MRAPRHATLLGIAGFPLGVLAVHQARYVLAYGGRASAELADQGHAYLGPISSLIVVLVAAAVGGFVGHLARVWRDGDQELGARPSIVRLWAVAAIALLAVYTGQEMLEGLLATGHPEGLVGAFGGGGLWAVPASIVVAAALAGLLAGGRRAVAAVAQARVHAPRLRLAAPWPVSLLLAPFMAPRLTPLDWAAPGRGPPAAARATA